jgi:hypothetical protein
MSPNTIVTAKVLLTVANQLEELAWYQSAGLLDLTRPPAVVEDADPLA